MLYEEFESRYLYNPIDDRIGGGGFGEVYKAKDVLRNRWVAIKECKVEVHKFSLKREVELAAEMDFHPNLARYENSYRFKLGRIEIDYAVMKYYEDGSLSNILKNKKLSKNELIEIIEGVIRGLSHMHKEGFIHRDLKPGNILIERNDGKLIPKITDFGMSKLKRNSESDLSDSAIGKTIAYAAPEQIQNMPIRDNTDLWSLGVMVYKMCQGELPFLSNNHTSKEIYNIEISKKNVVGQIPDLTSLEEPFKQIIEKCLVVDINERIKSADELLPLLVPKKNDLDEEKVKWEYSIPPEFHQLTPIIAKNINILDKTDPIFQLSKNNNTYSYIYEFNKQSTSHASICAVNTLNFSYNILIVNFNDDLDTIIKRIKKIGANVRLESRTGLIALSEGYMYSIDASYILLTIEENEQFLISTFDGGDGVIEVLSEIKIINKLNLVEELNAYITKYEEWGPIIIIIECSFFKSISLALYAKIILEKTFPKVNTRIYNSPNVALIGGKILSQILMGEIKDLLLMDVTFCNIELLNSPTMLFEQVARVEYKNMSSLIEVGTTIPTKTLSIVYDVSLELTILISTLIGSKKEIKFCFNDENQERFKFDSNGKKFIAINNSHNHLTNNSKQLYRFEISVDIDANQNFIISVENGKKIKKYNFFNDIDAMNNQSFSSNSNNTNYDSDFIDSPTEIG